jgi:hypothetical protein
MMARNATFFLFFATLFLAACSASLGSVDPLATSASLSASEINAAAERAATAEHAATVEDEATAVSSPENSPVDTPPSDAPSDPQTGPTTITVNPDPVEETPTETAPESGPAINRRVDVGEIGRFPQLMPFDAIRPVYEPIFATAEDAPLDDRELIIGIALDGEAKAYPITVLRFREMVNDELAGIPTLVTW